MNDDDEPITNRIEVSPAVVATIEQPTTERPGQKIGRYKLLEQIGEGGMGTVWIAEQSEPVKRRVALKLIKPGMDSRQVLSRFEAERQALALMDHPNIAKVHDGGMTEAGRPFFVMELVKGVPITEYCDSVRLPIPERLKLFIAVCQAVQHAHQKGIIHRDLKPSNILVCLYDGQPVPKVIDFGLAKAISQSLTEHTLYTAQGMMVGTPLYMSPEQAEYNNLDVDTRTDIYSLGVILYELLTGVTPLEKRLFKNVAVQEVLRLIKEIEPPKPSTRLSALSRVGCAHQPGDPVASKTGGQSPPYTSSLKYVAAQRGLEPAQLSRLIRGDLDWIVMKSLEKERSRRYETANGLARDIERHLNDEPVEASPPSASYRLRKLARKHRGSLLTASAIAALLLLGIAASTWQAIRATKAETIARASEEKARLATTQALASAASEREARQHAQTAAEAESQARKQAEAAAESERIAKQSAQDSAAEAKAVLDFVENRVFAAARPEGQDGGLGHNVTLREAVNSALAFVDQGFQEQPRIEASLRNTLGISFLYLGEMDVAGQQFEAARRLNARHFGPDHPNTLIFTSNVAFSYYGLGQYEEALKLREEMVPLLRARFGPDHFQTLFNMAALASSYGSVGRRAEAVKLYEETLALMKAKLGPQHLATLECVRSLADSYVTMGRHDEAIKLHEETLSLRMAEFGPDHPHTLVGMHALACSYSAVGRHVEALRLFEDTLELRKTKLGDTHQATLDTMNRLAESYAALGRQSEALKLREAMLPLRKARHISDHPATLGTMHALACSYAVLGRHAEALQLFEETLKLRKTKLGDAHQATLDTMDGLAGSYAALGRHSEALQLREDTLNLRKAKLGLNHLDTLRSMHALACSYSSVGRRADALQLFEETLALRKATLGDGHHDTLDTMNWLAGIYDRLGRHDKALDLFQQILVLQKANWGPDHPDTLLSMWRLAENLTTRNRTAEAIPIIDDCLKRAPGKAVDPRLLPAVINLRLQHFKSTKDPLGCRATAEMWENLQRMDAASLYDAARFRAAVAAIIKARDKSETGQKELTIDADRAMDWLQKAVAAGYKDAAHMAKDKDLDSLRDRDDFKQLLASLEATEKPSPE